MSKSNGKSIKVWKRKNDPGDPRPSSLTDALFLLASIKGGAIAPKAVIEQFQWYYDAPRGTMPPENYQKGMTRILNSMGYTLNKSCTMFTHFDAKGVDAKFLSRRRMVSLQTTLGAARSYDSSPR